MGAQKFELGDAVFFFFKRVGEQPLSALWLMLWHVALVGAFMAGVFAWIWPPVSGLITLGINNPNPSEAEVFALLGPFFMGIAGVMLGALLLVMLVYPMWLRFLARDEVAMLIPIRFGSDEFRFLGVALLLIVFGFLVDLVLNIVGGIAGVGALGTALLFDDPMFLVAGTGMFGGLFFLLWIAGRLFVWIRLSPALALSFIDRRFRFFESWDATRPYGWQMLFALVLAFLLVMVMMIPFIAVFMFFFFGSILPIVIELENANFASDAEAFQAVTAAFTDANLLVPGGIALAVLIALDLVADGVMHGVSIYVARLHRSGTPDEATDVPVIDGDSPLGATPSEG